MIFFFPADRIIPGLPHPFYFKGKSIQIDWGVFMKAINAITNGLFGCMYCIVTTAIYLNFLC